MAKREEKAGTILRRTYLKIHNIICDRMEQITGQRPKDYKKMDTRVLIRFFNSLERKQMDGFEFMTYVLSTLIVEQALPNTNHRTTLSFVAVWLDTAGFGFKFELETHDRRMTQYILDSKVIIENRGTDKRYRANHVNYQPLKVFSGVVQ
ncbi:MAG: hypothetical protein KKH41_05135 [Candidatus Thermoplasmatota archaeon]|nr:hypothetical protein [Euryarchaeota archaeon]MBU4032484.1 hypothetical protein [Candidatus Thermoplasmatota archaeon]MBU4072128.1 hypothetical protein [Candidatus Thermoplasmatota archaeon]MBU4143538.1 hypothetical protein [Candidatus Thermoplasmatota archaeon]MBU4591951.1 hypothetical protein [Candidatus Thermoplasmatota archaeon]